MFTPMTQPPPDSSNYHSADLAILPADAKAIPSEGHHEVWHVNIVSSSKDAFHDTPMYSAEITGHTSCIFEDYQDQCPNLALYIECQIVKSYRRSTSGVDSSLHSVRPCLRGSSNYSMRNLARDNQRVHGRASNVLFDHIELTTSRSHASPIFTYHVHDDMIHEGSSTPTPSVASVSQTAPLTAYHSLQAPSKQRMGPTLFRPAPPIPSASGEMSQRNVGISRLEKDSITIAGAVSSCIILVAITTVWLRKQRRRLVSREGIVNSAFVTSQSDRTAVTSFQSLIRSKWRTTKPMVIDAPLSDFQSHFTPSSSQHRAQSFMINTHTNEATSGHLRPHSINASIGSLVPDTGALPLGCVRDLPSPTSSYQSWLPSETRENALLLLIEEALCDTHAPSCCGPANDSIQSDGSSSYVVAGET